MTDIEKDGILPEQEMEDPIIEPTEAPFEEGETEEEQLTQEEWKQALSEVVKQRDEYLLMAQRAKAEFQNFKKRNETARSDGYREGICEALTAVLTSIDNLERAIEAAPEPSPLKEGVEMTLKALLDETKKLGLEEVPALGELFDPELHNAVMRVSEGEPGTILEVFQKGYRAKDKILRYPMVKVAAE